MEFVEIIIRYAIYPLLLIICHMGWHMYKKLDSRVDATENRVNENEKDIIEIKTEFQTDIKYMSRDIKEIKELLKTLSGSK